jgi:plastocyanin
VRSGTFGSVWAPNSVVVGVGGTVTFQWTGVHNVSIPSLGNSSGEAVSGGSHAVTFSAPGSYAFVCDAHANTMTGTVTVQ